MECKTGADVNAHNKAGNFAWIYPESNRMNTIKAGDLVKLILCPILWHICILEQNQLFGFRQCLSRVWTKVNSFYKLQPILWTKNLSLTW